MFEDTKKIKISSSILTVITVVVAVTIFFINDQNLRKQAYEGKIVETYKSRKWLRFGTNSTTRRPRYRQYNYYWKIEDTNGETREVKVPHSTWSKGKPSTPVKKVAGERYPRIDTAAANHKQDVMNQMF